MVDPKRFGAFSKERKRLVYSAVIVLLGFFVLLAANIAYTNHVQHTSDKQFCEVLTIIDETPPPNAPLKQKKVAYALHKLSQEKGCIDGTS